MQAPQVVADSCINTFHVICKISGFSFMEEDGLLFLGKRQNVESKSIYFKKKKRETLPYKSIEITQKIQSEFFCHLYLIQWLYLNHRLIIISMSSCYPFPVPRGKSDS